MGLQVGSRGAPHRFFTPPPPQVRPIGQSAPHSRVPPQPSPILPQYLPPVGVQVVRWQGPPSGWRQARRWVGRRVRQREAAAPARAGQSTAATAAASALDGRGSAGGNQQGGNEQPGADRSRHGTDSSRTPVLAPGARDEEPRAWPLEITAGFTRKRSRWIWQAGNREPGFEFCELMPTGGARYP